MISKLVLRACLIKTKYEGTDQNRSAGTQEADKVILCIFSFGDHKLSWVHAFSVLSFLIMLWGLPSVDVGTLSLRDIQMIFSPAEARSKNQLGVKLCIPAEITCFLFYLICFPPSFYFIKPSCLELQACKNLQACDPKVK